MSKTTNDAVLETVDPYITETCKHLMEVKPLFQLALLCTKTDPTDRPTMHNITGFFDSYKLSDLPPPVLAAFPVERPRPTGRLTRSISLTASP